MMAAPPHPRTAKPPKIRRGMRLRTRMLLAAWLVILSALVVGGGVSGYLRVGIEQPAE
jgi:hypothetical protein